MHKSSTMLFVATLVGSIFCAPATQAQDSNTLDRHLEHQQWQRLQDHQNQSRTMSPGDKKAAQASSKPQLQTCSADALPAADRRHLEAEYVRRARADGKVSADAWVREQGKQFRLKLIAQGVCSDPEADTRSAANNRAKPDQKGCDMVMRPVAGLGGAPMTMAMVPDCGDD
ncbi:hypothetical protein M2333_002288 [Sphingobium sp. B11D3B]|uniref:hypothetical protein n=1 Tax=unclassified Sphingobium TaxID=2611147 RepID=UPI00222569E6|nr:MULTISPECIES: hypothetical protein [unclassified Sphingobium]MCW2365124.1 hypothetical protein [Sphingobium sp. B7D2B]MCW2389242.1 hypothetical protein [Sphingobium sp. B11D3B]